MNYDEAYRRMLPHLQTIAGADVDIGPDIDLIDQVGLDSYKVLDLVMEIEDEFDIAIPINVLADVRTAEDFARKIKEIVEAH